MSDKDVFPVRFGLHRRDQEEENKRVRRFAVDALLKYLREETGCVYLRVRQPDEEVRDKPAPDWECRNETTESSFGVELVDDFSYPEQQEVMRLLPNLGPGESIVVPAEDPRSSLQRVILAKQGKGQLKDYSPGHRILLVALRRIGSSFLLQGLSVEQLRQSVTYMDAAPDIDHVFVWELVSRRDYNGAEVWHMWSRTALP